MVSIRSAIHNLIRGRLRTQSNYNGRGYANSLFLFFTYLKNYLMHTSTKISKDCNMLTID